MRLGAAVGAEDTRSLPGSRQSLEQIFKAYKIAYLVACEAVAKPDRVIIGNMTDQATQTFQVTAPLAGKCPAGTFALTYGIIAPHDRQVAKGERVIWIVTEFSGGGEHPVLALADTAANRQAVLAFAKATKMSLAPSTQPATIPGTAPDDGNHPGKDRPAHERLSVYEAGSTNWFGTVWPIVNSTNGIPDLIRELSCADGRHREFATSVLRQVYSHGISQDPRSPPNSAAWWAWWEQAGKTNTVQRLWHNFDSHYQ
jgi:hypothetical protein